MTVRDLCISTLKLLGVVGPGETPTADELNDTFARLNELVEDLGNQRLTISNVDRVTLTLTAGQQYYTIGPGGDINGVRPVFIENASVVSYANPLQPVELPLEWMTDDDWATLAVKGVTSPLPRRIYYNATFPLGEIALWPVPSDSTVELALYTPVAVTQFASLNTVLALPPGWTKFLRFSLALELAPEFGKALDPTIAAFANEMRANIKRVNVEPLDMRVDPALNGGAGRHGVFNWMTGETT